MYWFAKVTAAGIGLPGGMKINSDARDRPAGSRYAKLKKISSVVRRLTVGPTGHGKLILGLIPESPDISVAPTFNHNI